ncbi:MAG: hypothetical protein LBH43_09235 [Treponema sp.]|jgi:hypothetical protein|nr:hypothetical protein [Treponema sp.]
MGNEKPLYTLIPLDDFKAVLGIDDREDKLARFCLVTSTFTIEQYCKWRFLRKKQIEQIEHIGDLLLPLQEYPVSSVLAVYLYGNGEMLEPEFYSVIPDCGTDIDIQFTMPLSPALQRYRNLSAVKVVYWAGYSSNKVPADLASACLELASWNMNRYRGRRVGMTGNIRGAGKEGEHFEPSMPENVKQLLEPYRRKTI